MRRILIVTVGIAAILLAMSRVAVTRESGAPPSVSACFPMSQYAEAQLGFLRRIAVSPSETDSIYGEDIKVPRVADTSMVYLVADSATCAAAVAPHNQVAGYSASELANAAAQRVYLFRVGAVWVASNPHVHEVDDHVGHVVMDSAYQRLSSYLH